MAKADEGLSIPKRSADADDPQGFSHKFADVNGIPQQPFPSIAIDVGPFIASQPVHPRPRERQGPAQPPAAPSEGALIKSAGAIAILL